MAIFPFEQGARRKRGLSLAWHTLRWLIAWILVQVALFGLLLWVHDAAEQYSVRAGNLRNFISIQSIVVFRTLAAISRVNDALDHNKPLAGAAIRDEEDIERYAQELIDLKKDDPRYCQIVSDLLTKVKNMLTLANQFSEANPNSTTNEQKKAIAQKLRDSGREITMALLPLEEGTKPLSFHSPAEVARERKGPVIIIVVAGIFDVLFIFLSWRFFSTHILYRLKVIDDNTVRLAVGSDLNPPIRGSDEFARLDETFHRMADLINEAARQQRSMVENARDVICTLDAKGNFSDVSKACNEVLGYDPSELIGSKVMNLVLPEDAERTWNELKAIMDGAEKPSIETRLKRKNGSPIDMLWSVIWSPTEKTLFCVAHDVTQQRAAERLRQEVVQMVSHDLRSPLATIQSFHQMIDADMFGSLDEQGKHLLAIAERNVYRMSALIDDLLMIERLEAGALELTKSEVEVSSIFNSSVSSVMAAASAKRIKIVGPQTDLRMFADENRLVQVVINLLSNAIKFSPADAMVTLSAEELPGGVEIKVSDQGRGIPEHMLESIFDRFRQVRASDAKEQKGTGLGLAICKALVELHGGTIRVESKEGQGSSFAFFVPAGSAGTIDVSKDVQVQRRISG